MTEKNGKKTYVVEYWEHRAVFMDVEADTPEEAEQRMEELVANGKIDLVAEMELGDSGYDVIGEKEQEI